MASVKSGQFAKFAIGSTGATNYHVFSAASSCPSHSPTNTERILREVASSLKDHCPFLREMSDASRFTVEDANKFATRCPFGRIVFQKMRKETEEADIDFSRKEEGGGVMVVPMESSLSYRFSPASLMSSVSLKSPALPQSPPHTTTTLPIENSSGQAMKTALERDCFEAALMKLRSDGSYRHFNHIDRHVGKFPLADNRLDILGPLEQPQYLEHLQKLEDPRDFYGAGMSVGPLLSSPAKTSLQMASSIALPPPFSSFSSASSSSSAASTRSLCQKAITVWCSNDYLGMGQHPEVLSAMKDAIDRFGAGSGGTRNISGTTSLHVLLETELADLHHKEAALLFSSCYAANASIIPTLISKLPPDTIIFSDEKNHASLIEGIRNSRAQKRIFRHNDVDHLRELLLSSDRRCAKLIVFESVYSMDGTIGPIGPICDLADEFGAFTLLDEVHAVGLYGPRGGGVAEALGLMDRVDLITGTLGKAYGLFGGFVTGRASMIDLLRSCAGGFIFTTSLPPAIVAGALVSVRLLKQDRRVADLQWDRAARLKRRLAEACLPTLATPSHFVPLLVGDAHLCRAVSERLLTEHRLYLQPINFPTVAHGTERFRITASPVHSDRDIDILVRALESAWHLFGLYREETLRPLRLLQLRYLEQLQKELHHNHHNHHHHNYHNHHQRLDIQLGRIPLQQHQHQHQQYQ